MSGGPAALDGIRVLELGRVMAGPFCALQLCDMGADVIKVEPPGGDPTRQMGARAGTDSACFTAMNRGKRGIVLDLKSAAGREALARLAAGADVFIENFRPGVMSDLGLDYPALSAANPRLIYASISGYGQTGPDRTKGGFDLVAPGASGRSGRRSKCPRHLLGLNAARHCLASTPARCCDKRDSATRRLRAFRYLDLSGRGARSSVRRGDLHR